MIALSQVQKVNAGTTIIDIAELHVAAGEIAGLTGLTGPARLSLLDLLIGRSRPTAGTIRLAGIDPAAAGGALAARLGVLLSENGLYPRLTVGQNLTLFADLYGLAGDQIQTILQRVGLQDQAKTRVDDLAPGLARRLAFGRAILHEPDILLLVDPFLDCDEASVAIISRQIQASGAATLIIAAAGPQLHRLCQVVYVTEQGRLTQNFDPRNAGADAPTGLPFKIPARLEGKVALVNPADILYATTVDGQTLLCTQDGPIATHLTLTEVEERLARSGFFRAHRAYLVNLQHIKEVIAYTRNSYALVLDEVAPGVDGSAEIPLSKGAAKELRDLMGY